jgi:hypothetical protein
MSQTDERRPEDTGRRREDAAAKPQASDLQSRCYTAALAYATHGWPVLPVALAVDGRCSCGWPPRLCNPDRSPGKHPLNRGGCRNASADPEQVRAWWRRWPAANVGVAAGARSGLGVLDVDGEPGRLSLAAIEAEQGPLPGTVTAITSRGCHLLYRWAAGLGNGAGTYGRGLDHRGEGGYILAPPSVHPSGHVYRWLSADDSDPQPWARPLPPWPVDALPLAKGEPEQPAPATSVRPTVRGIAGIHGEGSPGGILEGLVRCVLDAPRPGPGTPGERNTRLNWAAFRAGEHIRAGKLHRTTAITALQLAGEQVGLTGDETRATIRSGFTAGAGEAA